jgi:uncharacterized protein YukJ/tRNA(Arg) A34 adenosine deaminase TadA
MTIAPQALRLPRACRLALSNAMALGSYGVLVGTLERHERDQPDNQGKWFHVNVFLDVAGEEHHCAIDVDSKQSNTGVEWKVLELEPQLWAAELALEFGLHRLETSAFSGALDYARAARLGAGQWSRGSATDAANVLEPLLDQATRILVFGEPFSSHGRGMHNIHQNQGDPAGSQWWDDNGPWQDGATLILRGDGTLLAFLNKFTSQTYATDEEGHAPYHPPRPKTGRLGQIWRNSVASLAAVQNLQLEAAEIERHQVYGYVVQALLAHYWNGNKRGRFGRYPFREGQLADGQYLGGDYLGHNIACIAVDENGEIIDFDFNHNDVFQSSVEHAESRLVRRIFSLTQLFDGWATQDPTVPQPTTSYATQLSGVTLYTSLESCAQCSGIMALGSVRRVVFLQRDPGQGSIGNILRNLMPQSGSFAAPLPVPANLLGLTCFDALEAGYARFSAEIGEAKPFYESPTGDKDKSASITSYLCTDDALRIFREGTDALTSLVIQHPSYVAKGRGGQALAKGLTNERVLAHARRFLDYATRLGRRGTPHQL